MSYRARFCPAGTLAVAFIYGLGSLWAQNDRAADPLPTMERKRQQKLLNQEFRAPYKKWLNEDVFQRLMSDDEREQFIEQFWLRRDPTPDILENGFKEEHYRRIAYANDHFASAIPGWKTDRGRIYITYGPPDEVQSRVGGSYERAESGETFTYPIERWTYRYLEGIGDNVIIEFADTTMSGEYPLTTDLYETPPVSPRFEPQEALQKTPHVQSKDLEALISSQSL
jgi:GWxTD domain-containing protein